MTMTLSLYCTYMDDVERGVEADVVRQVQGAHGVARAQLHGHVDVAHSGVCGCQWVGVGVGVCG